MLYGNTVQESEYITMNRVRVNKYMFFHTNKQEMFVVCVTNRRGFMDSSKKNVSLLLFFRVLQSADHVWSLAPKQHFSCVPCRNPLRQRQSPESLQGVPGAQEPVGHGGGLCPHPGR